MRRMLDGAAMSKPVARQTTSETEGPASVGPHSTNSGVFDKRVFESSSIPTPPPSFDFEAFAKASGSCTVAPPPSVRGLDANIGPDSVLLPPTWEALPTIAAHELAAVLVHLDGKTPLRVLARGAGIEVEQVVEACRLLVTAGLVQSAAD